MDPVSHVALAYNLAHLQRGPGARTGVVPAALLGALSPDVDVFLLPAGWDRYMVAHESGTHSIAGALVCAALAAGLVRGIWRDGRYLAMFGAAVIGAGSHVWFDVFSGATIRLWWPFAEARVSNLGAFAMADPLVAIACLSAAVLIWWQRARRARIAAMFAGLLLVFVTAKTIARMQAQTLFAARIPDSGPTLVLPEWGSLTRWEVIAHHHSALNQWGVDLWRGTIDLRMAVPDEGLSPTAQRAIADSLDWDTVRNFRRTHDFAFPTARTAPSSSASSPPVTRVMWSDLRYCSPLPGADVAPYQFTCAVTVGGERTSPDARPRLIVMIGEIVQVR